MKNKDSTAQNQPSKLERRDVWALILATYQVTLPYLVVFIALMLLALWLITEVIFVG